MASVLFLGLSINSGYSIPFGPQTNPSLKEIVEGRKNGKFEYYPGVVRVNSFGAKVLPGFPYILTSQFKKDAVLPEVKDIQALLRAAKKKQVVKVASTDTSKFQIQFPVFKEIAKQNGISYDELMAHFAEWAEEGSMVHDVTATADHLDKMLEEEVNKALDDVVEEITKVTEEVAEEIVEEINIEDILAKHGYNINDYTYSEDWVDNALQDDGLVITDTSIVDAEGNELK